MKFLSAIGFLLCSTTAQATELPALYAVIGLSNDQALNIRDTPAHDAKLLSGFTHNADQIEVVEITEFGDFGRVNIEETTGWVAMEFLTPMPADDPVKLSCAGTEPFWNLTLDDAGKSDWATPSSTGSAIFTKGENGMDRMGQITMSETSATPGLEVEFQAMITPQLCSNGMTDNQYALKASILLKGYTGFASPEGDETVTGCCSIQPWK